VHASRTRKEKFSGPGENCQINVTDLAGSLVTSSRPPGQPQKRPDDRTSNAGVVVRTADASRRTADAADEQCLRCGCSSLSCTVVLCAADISSSFGYSARTDRSTDRNRAIGASWAPLPTDWNRPYPTAFCGRSSPTLRRSTLAWQPPSIGHTTDMHGA